MCNTQDSLVTDECGLSTVTQLKIPDLTVVSFNLTNPTSPGPFPCPPPAAPLIHQSLEDLGMATANDRAPGLGWGDRFRYCVENPPPPHEIGTDLAIASHARFKFNLVNINTADP